MTLKIRPAVPLPRHLIGHHMEPPNHPVCSTDHSAHQAWLQQLMVCCRQRLHFRFNLWVPSCLTRLIDMIAVKLHRFQNFL